MTERTLTLRDDAREYLLQAIEEDRFILLEQKIVPLEQKVDSLDLREVLLRMRGENNQAVAPGGFFDVAEHHGVLPLVDRWVIRNLLKSCAAWKAADRSWRMPVYCVNLSSATVADVTFPVYLRAQLAHWQLAGNRLCFEVSQGTVAARASDTYALMNAVKPLGCRFSVDAFGSHETSFATVEHLEFNFVKIDGPIVEAAVKHEEVRPRLASIVNGARALGLRTIGQFVQNDETRAKLAEIGVDYVQGFGVSKPAALGGSNGKS